MARPTQPNVYDDNISILVAQGVGHTLYQRLGRQQFKRLAAVLGPIAIQN
jgi:hypothetical protein